MHAFFRVFDWGCDHVIPASPFAEIKRAAAPATERKFGIAVLHVFLADWAADLHCALAGHRKTLSFDFTLSEEGLKDSRYQIVVVSFGDLAAIEAAEFGGKPAREIVHEDFAVDFGSVHGGAAFHQ